MITLNFFDCNCMIGRRSLRQPREFDTAEELAKEMAYYGISKALVYHSLAKEYFPPIGNERLLNEIKDFRQLHPCWVLLPHHCEEMVEPAVLIEEMLEKRIRAARLFPSPSYPGQHSQYFSFKDHRYELAQFTCGDILNVLEKYKIPLFLDLQPVPMEPLISWEKIYEICYRYSDLPLVLTYVRQRDNRNLYPLLEKFDNLHIDLSLYTAHHGIEEICHRFGADRLLFGSGMPLYTPGGALTSIMYSSISEKERQMIAGDNLRKLLGLRPNETTL